MQPCTLLVLACDVAAHVGVSTANQPVCVQATRVSSFVMHSISTRKVWLVATYRFCCFWLVRVTSASICVSCLCMSLILAKEPEAVASSPSASKLSPAPSSSAAGSLDLEGGARGLRLRAVSTLVLISTSRLNISSLTSCRCCCCCLVDAARSRSPERSSATKTCYCGEALMQQVRMKTTTKKRKRVAAEALCPALVKLSRCPPCPQVPVKAASDKQKRSTEAPQVPRFQVSIAVKRRDRFHFFSLQKRHKHTLKSTSYTLITAFH